MSEELVQRHLDQQGLAFGDYQFYNIGSTTIRTLNIFKIIPNKPYTGILANRPDALLVDRRNLNNISVVVVLENKAVEEFNTPEKKQKAIKQCVEDYCKPLGAKIGIVTDTYEYVWINPQLENDKYEIIIREDNYPLHLPFQWSNQVEIEQTLQVLRKVLSDVSPSNSQLKKEQLQNPSNLADRVWQTIWLASGENPDACLATFVEIFVYKYLSDLGVLVKNDTGVSITFADTLAIERNKSLVFYFRQVRNYIKEIFPAGSDGTSIINGIILNPDNSEHNSIFYQILQEFKAFGALTHIDPEFKSRLYENFLKKSISQKNWGQFFTPRNIVKAMIEMSEIEQLGDGAKVHDPACGVGGFILEPILTKRPRDYIFYNGRLVSRLQYTGYDKDSKTIILAKANMLIYLNELMRTHSTASQEFAQVFNATFRAMDKSVFGSIGLTSVDEYDLIMTNPPFVMTGTSKIKELVKENGQLRQYYAINASGIEGLFLEKIVRSLKPGGKALIVVPDGVLNRGVDKKLRKFISDECNLEAIVSLPENTFYTTPKKTYILVITKKAVKGIVQTEPVFSYLVVNTGETLDAKRFETDNDLPEMVRLFKYFRADKSNFVSPTKKCKTWSFDRFDPNTHWSVDRWWTDEEKIELGIENQKNLITLKDFANRLEEEKQKLEEAIQRLKALDEKMPQPEATVEIELNDSQFFELFIGKRVLKEELYGKTGGEIPIYSANVKQPFGMTTSSNISDFSRDVVLWGIDGYFEFNVLRRAIPFRTTDHCGCIRIIDDDIDADYLYYYLTWIGSNSRIDRQLRASLQNVKKLKIKFPVFVGTDGKPKTKTANKKQQDKEQTGIYALDLETQTRIALFYKTFEQIKGEIAERMQRITTLEIPPLI